MANHQKIALILTVSCVLLNCCHAGVTNNNVDDPTSCYLSEDVVKEIRSYQTVADKIIQEIVNGKFKGETWKMLAEFIDTFGARMTGSETLEKSIDHMVNLSKHHGLNNVKTEQVKVPAWSRGKESLKMTHPVKRDIPVLALGTSIGGQVTGQIVAVDSFDELANKTDAEIAGKIVVFNPAFVSYGQTVRYRSQGASAASRRGATAALVRAVTQQSMRTLHTGMQTYGQDVRPIPVATITMEDAEMLHRMHKRGENITLELCLESHQTEKMSRNTIVELTGSDPKVQRPIVVVSGHIDSWDVGDGAMDDGGGVMVSFATVRFLRELNLIPRRTMRAIFWTAEEQGYVGSQAYGEAHKAEEPMLNYVMESDMGTFRPRGLDFSGSHDAGCILQQVLRLMQSINTTQFATPQDGGPDIQMWTNKGIPGSSLMNENENYFWYHHTPGDSMVLEDPHNLDLCAAVWTVASYVIADLSFPMPRN